MQGIELSRRFYIDVVSPWLTAAAPRLLHSAALIGYGSELLGFDDETSRDHNWGPRVQLFVSPESFSEWAHTLVDAFGEVAPLTFLGEPIGYRSRPNPPSVGPDRAGNASHGLEILTLEACLQEALGISSVSDIAAVQWLGFSEQRLVAFTAGAVFHDDNGRLGALRKALAYFPNDIWLYRIACQWLRIAEEQAFVGRAGQVGDDLGSRILAGRLARDVVRMAFLLDRRYVPYAKWLGSAFAKLPIARALSPHLQCALSASDWRVRGEALASSYLVLARYQRACGIGGAFEPVIGPYHDRPFATINADDLVAATAECILDPDIRSLPIVGALDQVTDLTPVLVDPQGSHRMMRALFE